MNPKTYKDVFFERNITARFDLDGYPWTCVKHIFKDFPHPKDGCVKTGCKKCWDTPYTPEESNACVRRR